jgi:hypothetical protein
MGAVRVTLDRSRDHATVHGERGPNDPHSTVFFYQNGLPFDAEGNLIETHPDLQGDGKEAVKRRAIVTKLQTRAEKQAEKQAERETAVAAGETVDDDGLDDEAGDAGGDVKIVDLGKWARGEQKYMWTAVSNAITDKFKQRVVSKAEGIKLLVKQGVVAPGSLSDEHKKYLSQ